MRFCQSWQETMSGSGTKCSVALKQLTVTVGTKISAAHALARTPVRAKPLEQNVRAKPLELRPALAKTCGKRGGYVGQRLDTSVPAVRYFSTKRWIF
jgi:hypothetical protein